MVTNLLSCRYKNKNLLFSLLLGILLGCLPYVSDAKKKTPVYLVAGQSSKLK